MSDKGRTPLENAADKINDVVEDLTLDAADAAVERNAKCVAAKVKEQVDLPEISESPSLPGHIDPTSSGRAARERLKYVEQIVAAAAAPKSVKYSTKPTRLGRSKKRRATLRNGAN